MCLRLSDTQDAAAACALGRVTHCHQVSSPGIHMLHVLDEEPTRDSCCFMRGVLPGLPVFSVRSNRRGGSAAEAWELSFFVSTDLMLPRLLLDVSPLPFAGCPPPCRHRRQRQCPHRIMLHLARPRGGKPTVEPASHSPVVQATVPPGAASTGSRGAGQAA